MNKQYDADYVSHGGMTEKQKLQALFPLEAWITPAILETSNVSDVFRCPGATTLRIVTGLDFQQVGWFWRYGWVHVGDIAFDVTTEELIDFTKITEPQKVTFILRHENRDDQ